MQALAQSIGLIHLHLFVVDAVAKLVEHRLQKGAVAFPDRSFGSLFARRNQFITTHQQTNARFPVHLECRDAAPGQATKICCPEAHTCVEEGGA